MGITHHEHGVNNVPRDCEPGAAAGDDRAEGGVLPLRGHSNVQGMGSMGVVPELKGSVVKAIEGPAWRPLPKRRGWTRWRA